MNKLVVIGWIGCKYCYLNISEEDAINRYCISEEITSEEFNNNEPPIDILEFNDEFGAYAIYNL